MRLGGGESLGLVGVLACRLGDKSLPFGVVERALVFCLGALAVGVGAAMPFGIVGALVRGIIRGTLALGLGGALALGLGRDAQPIDFVDGALALGLGRDAPLVGLVGTFALCFGGDV